MTGTFSHILIFENFHIADTFSPPLFKPSVLAYNSSVDYLLVLTLPTLDTRLGVASAKPKAGVSSVGKV